MNQHNLKAYLNLIQELLSCPRGEEWILLRQHGDLVNGELVEIMEQVANQLAIDGKIKAAKYLHNWAGKLHHILTESVPRPANQNDKTQNYIELIQALLDCPEGEEESILEAHKDLINPQLVKVMQQVANQMAAEGNESTASFLSNLATDLSRIWLEKHEFQPSFKKEIAPDPWFDEDNPPPENSVTETQPTHSARETVATPQETEITPVSTPQTQIEQKQPEIQQPREIAFDDTAKYHVLKGIAESLVRLEQVLTSRLQPPNPLWYMDVLTKAEAANWILTTDEVEHLIGVKPHCNHDETTYHRGSWVFIKTGKIGAQTGWRVEKQTNSVND